MTISSNDIQKWWSALEHKPKQPTDLLVWMEAWLKEFFPFKRAILLYGVSHLERLEIQHFIQIGHDEAYLRSLELNFAIASRGAFQRWIHERQPLLIDPACPPAYITQYELDEIHRYSLGRIAAHGQIDLNARSGTYFSFSGISAPLSSWHCEAMKLIAPVLNDLYLHYILHSHRPQKPAWEMLTPRRLAIVQHLMKGKNNKEIGRSLDISEKTVRNQLSAIYAEYQVNSRTKLLEKYAKSAT